MLQATAGCGRYDGSFDKPLWHGVELLKREVSARQKLIMIKAANRISVFIGAIEGCRRGRIGGIMSAIGHWRTVEKRPAG